MMERLPNLNLRSNRLAVAALIGAALVAGTTLVACTSHTGQPSPSSTANSSEINLINTSYWTYMPGVTVKSQDLQVGPTDFRIVHQDGTGGQPNPPLNLGTRLETAGDFRITATIEDPAADASLTLADSPPIIADEFRLEPPNVRITEVGNDLDMKIYDGSDQADATNPKPVDEQSFQLSSNHSHDISVSKEAGALIISADGKQLASKPYGKLFVSGNVWLGIDSSKGSFKVSRLEAAAIGKSSLKAVDATILPYKLDLNGLQALANKVRPGFKIGAAVALGPLVADATYDQELFGNFGSVTPENVEKWQNIEPLPGVFTTQYADEIIDIAKAHGQVIHGHPVIFGEELPKWVQDLPPDEAKSALITYVKHWVQHFGKDLASADVTNEVLADPDVFDPQTNVYNKNVWYQKLGRDYVKIAIQTARATNPKLKIVMNENGLENDSDRQQAMLDLLDWLKSQGAAPDEIGLQGHVYESGDMLDTSVFNNFVNKLRNLGYGVRVSELDVYSDDGANVQADGYLNSTKSCIKNGNCDAETVWGVNNRYDKYQDNPNGPALPGKDLLFDYDNKTKLYTPTFAYDRLISFLKANR